MRSNWCIFFWPYSLRRKSTILLATLAASLAAPLAAYLAASTFDLEKTFGLGDVIFGLAAAGAFDLSAAAFGWVAASFGWVAASFGWVAASFGWIAAAFDLGAAFVLEAEPAVKRLSLLAKLVMQQFFLPLVG